MNDEAPFGIKYEGGLFDQHLISADNLIEVTNGVQKLVDIISKSIGDEKAQVTLYVQAFEEGSFQEWFKIAVNLKGDEVNRFADNHPKMTATLIGGTIVIGVIHTVLTGITPDHIKATGAFIEGPVVKVIEKLAEQSRVKKAVADVISPYKKNLTDSSKLILESEGVKQEINATQIESALKNLSSEEEKFIRNEYKDKVVSLKKIDLQGGDKWEVLFNDETGKNHEISVIILDDEFLKFMKEKVPKYDKHDVLYADLEEQIIQRPQSRDTVRWFIGKIHAVKNPLTGEQSYPEHPVVTSDEI